MGEQWHMRFLDMKMVHIHIEIVPERNQYILLVPWKVKLYHYDANQQHMKQYKRCL